MLREIRLYGTLGETFGRVHHLAVQSPGEAVRALCALHQGFERAILQGAWRVWSGATRIGQPEDVCLPTGSREVIRIAPVLAGAGGGGLGRILIGAALIGASFFLPAAPLFTIGAFAPSIASIAASVGFSMVLGGITQMLSPQPKVDAGSDAEAANNRPSYVFNGAVNTTAQGQPVPVGYGRMIVGSAVLSAGLATEDI